MMEMDPGQSQQIRTSIFQLLALLHQQMRIINDEKNFVILILKSSTCKLAVRSQLKINFVITFLWMMMLAGLNKRHKLSLQIDL